MKDARHYGFWQMILLGIGLIAGTAIFGDRACDNSSLSPLLQVLFALPCFPLFLIWGYIAGIAFSRVRLAWSPALFGGRFRGRQPESLSIEEWSEIHAALRRGGDSWKNR